jgi:type IV secretory pathway VirB6-like protein
LISCHRKERFLDFVLYYYILLFNEPPVIFMFDKLPKYLITIVSSVLYKMHKCLYYLYVCFNLNSTVFDNLHKHWVLTQVTKIVPQRKHVKVDLRKFVYISPVDVRVPIS